MKTGVDIIVFLEELVRKMPLGTAWQGQINPQPLLPGFASALAESENTKKVKS